jgi:radical SAM-linked protein
VRERCPESIVSWAEEALMASGFEEVSLLSLSTGDYGCLTPLLTCLMDRLEQRRIALSLPSMRADTLSADLMRQIKRVRKTGFTIAPEAGSEKLRRAINKNLTEAEIFATIREAFELGWNLLKMYFMIGFPMEEHGDLQALADLCRQALAVARNINSKARLHVSINTFIPKPHTPFQWEQQLSRGESQERLHLTKNLLKFKGIDIKWNPSNQSWLEGILARGDRRLAPVLMEAQRLGCRFDAWTEHAKIGNWEKALAACDIREDFYLRQRREEEILPWDHIDVGVTREYLLAERRRAWEAVQTPDCRMAGCLDCGVCDWVGVQPRTYNTPFESLAITSEEVSSPDQITRYRLYYSKLDEAKWLSHLELMNIFYRSWRRSGLRLHFTQGFHPLPKVSFHGALPVGVESLTETMDIELAQPYSDLEVITRLNQVLPTGIKIHSIEQLSGDRISPKSDRHIYNVKTPVPIFFPEKVEKFLNSTEFIALKKKPKETKRIDIRPLVSAIHLRDLSNLEILINTREKDNLKINDLLAAIFNMTDTEALQLNVVKQKSYSSH